jgi:lipoate-protein ligase A
MTTEVLRVIDFGRVSPLRSQTLWHAIARGVSAGAPPTLSLMQPDSPYVSIGFHRRLDEVDQEECRRRGLPVYRRMVGGGPVYLDDAQVFFQITLPLADTPPVRSMAVRTLLEPAVEAFRALGIDAAIEDAGDVVVGDRKICGHGAGQIDQAVVVVGNLITSFDHTAASRIMAAPDEATTRELETLMKRYVAATPADAAAFRSNAVDSYAAALGRTAEVGSLTSVERETLADLDADFVGADWVRGPSRPDAAAWRVKIKAGVFVAHAAAGHSSVQVSVDSGRILRSRLVDPTLNGAADALEGRMPGLTVAEGTSVLAAAGQSQLAALLEGIEKAGSRANNGRDRDD